MSITVKKHYGTPMCSPAAMEIDGFDDLASLALDMRWSYDHTADELWQQLAPALWEETHNPWLVLQSVSTTQFERLLSSSSFRLKLDSVLKEREEEDTMTGWFATNHPNSALKTIAYFSMEFMLG